MANAMTFRKAGSYYQRTRHGTASNISKKRKFQDEEKSVTYTLDIVKNGMAAKDDQGKDFGKAAPEIWAETRQALCETLWWFRSYQGGLYHKDGVCYGALMDADGGERTYMDAEIIISRVGGGAEKAKNGDLVQVKDQKSDSATISCLSFNKDCGPYPIGVVAGQNHVQCETKLPHRYNVLGWYRVTDIWYERSSSGKGAVVGKVRYEKWDLGTDSWWAKKDLPEAPHVLQRDYDTKAARYSCPGCGVNSPQVYLEAMMCLNSGCEKFWTVKDGKQPPRNLTFNDIFLQERSPKIGHFEPADLQSGLAASALQGGHNLTGNRGLWKGMVCPSCGNCISRRSWSEWKCDNESCSFIQVDPMVPVPVSAVRPLAGAGCSGHPLFFNPLAKENKLGPSITKTSSYLKNYTQNSFQIPAGGLLSHLASFDRTNDGRWGPDSLFEQMQSANLGLQRFRMKQSVVTGQLMGHFTGNWGMEYEYVGEADSRPFQGAPDVIMAAMGRLSWAGQYVVNDSTFKPFNELLVLGYLEDQDIGWHDDGEDTLGPTIATLSLGSQATMSLRMKAKYYFGMTASGKLVPNDPILPGCLNYEQRRELGDKLAAGQISRAKYEASVLKFLKKPAPKARPPTCLEFTLNHGDLVVMHGADMQKYYEHAITPHGRMRFALTSRFVDPTLVPADSVSKGTFKLRCEHIYDGAR